MGLGGGGCCLLVVGGGRVGGRLPSERFGIIIPGQIANCSNGRSFEPKFTGVGSELSQGRPTRS